MAEPAKRVVWDACTWIALIQREKIQDKNGQCVEDRDTMCRVAIAAAKKGEIEIVTSTLCLAEVCKPPDSGKGVADKLADYFENDYVALANVDLAVAQRAREIMQAGYQSIKPPDAIHLATAALVIGVEEFHSFDGRLLKLDGRIDKADGTKLKICKPDSIGAPVPLLEDHDDKAEENPATPS